MRKQTTPDAAMHVSMLNTCVKLNMFETANELLEAIAANGGRISHRDGMQVVEAARRKTKGALVVSCVAAINSMSTREKTHDTKTKSNIPWQWGILARQKCDMSAESARPSLRGLRSELLLEQLLQEAG